MPDQRPLLAGRAFDAAADRNSAAVKRCDAKPCHVSKMS